MRVSSEVVRLAVVSLLVIVASGCKTTGASIPVDALPSQAATGSPEYVLQPGDLIAVRVWNQDSMTTRARIRSDGRISMPFLEDVEAAGATPLALAKRIQARLKDYLVNPVVTVSLEEPRALTIAVLGEVTRPGSYPLEPGSGVLPALAAAGGMTPFANRDAILIIRQKTDGTGTQRILFTYSGLTQAQGHAASFRLQGGDVVVVE